MSHDPIGRYSPYERKEWSWCWIMFGLFIWCVIVGLLAYHDGLMTGASLW